MALQVLIVNRGLDGIEFYVMHGITFIHSFFDMALAININDLLNKQKIESKRIEFKKGWNLAPSFSVL